MISDILKPKTITLEHVSVNELDITITNYIDMKI